MKLSKELIKAVDAAESAGLEVLDDLGSALRSTNNQKAWQLGANAYELKAKLERILFKIRDLARKEGEQG